VTRPLEISDLVVSYDATVVLRGVTVHVDAGEIVALLGANGAGKTTLLSTISGLLRPSSGSLDVLGDRAPHRHPHAIARQGLAHVPEERAIFADLTVEENLRLGRRRRGPIDLAFGYFPALAELRRRRAGLLSGGEQQMLALGRAICSGPRLLLVDEMSLGLAPILVERLLPVLRAVARNTACGVLLVEQHVDLALDVADRAYVLGRGRVVLEGTARELRGQRRILESSYLGDTAIARSSSTHTSASSA
jgi:branched-chain amino acid transport system ATP-binding protein